MLRTDPFVLTTLDLGLLTVYRIRAAGFRIRRSRRSGPGPYQLVLAMSGRAVVRQRQREARLAAGDIALYDASRPFDAGTDDAFVLNLPAEVVPAAPAAMEDLLAVRLPGHGRVAQVLKAVLCQLTARPETPPPADVARLSTVVLELVGGLVAAGPSVRAPEPPSRTDGTVLRINEFIDRNLDDPDLTPRRIASAHHISVRQLHKLYQGQGLTVAGWIRSRRLDACRRDLADPRHDDRPVHAIAVRWGFSDQSHFGRVFRAAFGATPAAWRRAARIPAGSWQPADTTVRSDDDQLALGGEPDVLDAVLAADEPTGAVEHLQDAVMGDRHPLPGRVGRDRGLAVIPARPGLGTVEADATHIGAVAGTVERASEHDAAALAERALRHDRQVGAHGRRPGPVEHQQRLRSGEEGGLAVPHDTRVAQLGRAEAVAGGPPATAVPDEPPNRRGAGRHPGQEQRRGSVGALEPPGFRRVKRDALATAGTQQVQP
jgi:AraC-like DNA-binding protein